MPEVFRFIQSRPPDVFSERRTLEPDDFSEFIDELREARKRDRPATRAQEIVAARIESGYLIASAEDLHHAKGYEQFFEEVDVDDPELSFADVESRVEAIFDGALADLSQSPDIRRDGKRLYEYIVALKLSAELQRDLAFNPARYLKLTHYIVQSGHTSAADAAEYFRDTFILLPRVVFPLPSLLKETLGVDADGVDPRIERELHDLTVLGDEVRGLEASLRELSFLTPADTRVVEEQGEALDRDDPVASLEDDADREAVRTLLERAEMRSRLDMAVSTEAKTLRFGGQLLLSDDKISRLSERTRRHLDALGLSPAASPVPSLGRSLEAELDASAARLAQLEERYRATVSVTRRSNYARLDHYRSQRYDKESPGLKLSELGGCGVGDLLVVKEQIQRYEAGEIAHIENVLKGEAKRREHRRLKRMEETFSLVTEQSTTEEREHETTERFELQKTASKVIEQDQEFAAGVKVKAKYGPFVEVEANADFSQSSNVQTSQSSASRYSKDVTDRAATIITSLVREEQTRKVIIETEETNAHELNNIGGERHTVGIYQWVDKILESQVYRYGLRTLCDFMVPEPAAFYVHSQVNKPLSTATPTPPPAFTITPGSVTRGSYRGLVATYKADGVQAPPEQWKTVSEAYDAKSEKDTHHSKTGKLVPPAGYRIATVRAFASVVHREGAGFGFGFGIGGSFRSGVGVHSVSADANGEAAISMFGRDVRLLVANAHADCEVTTEEFQKWQLETFDKLLQTHTVQTEQYEQALAASEVAEGIVIEGRNPGKNRKLEQNELKKGCISAFTGQNFDGLNGIRFSPQGYPEIDMIANELLGPVVRFFEQAFEWEQMMYLFYPYFWGRKPEWVKMINYEDVDPKFEEFLQAGFARVVVPVRPGFEVPLQHFLDTGVVWNGQPLPEVGSDMYVSIIQEVKERQQAPLGEEPFGEPWRVRLPTALVRLKDTSKLPEWEKDANGEWHPVPDGDGDIAGPSPAPIVQPTPGGDGP